MVTLGPTAQATLVHVLSHISLACNYERLGCHSSPLVSTDTAIRIDFQVPTNGQWLTRHNYHEDISTISWNMSLVIISWTHEISHKFLTISVNCE